MDINKENLLAEAKRRIDYGGVIATGIGAFAIIIRSVCEPEMTTEILLRRRTEKESIIHDKDLSGKWELPGGGMKQDDLVPGGDGYFGSIARTLWREVREETGLDLLEWKLSGAIFPAMLAREEGKQSLIDFALAVRINWKNDFATKDYQSRLQRGEIKWVKVGDLDKIKIVSPRMKFLIWQTVNDYMGFKRLE